jgi:hypothetical protein
MSARSLYRIAAAVFVLFAAGHTIGFLKFKPPTAEALAVRDAMTNVHFHVGHATFSYGNFYIGFGLYVTAYLLFSAFLAWHLGGLARSSPQAVGALGWVFCGVQVASLILSASYFSVVPAVLSGLLAACLGCAAAKVETARISGLEEGSKYRGYTGRDVVEPALGLTGRR